MFHVRTAATKIGIVLLLTASAASAAGDDGPNVDRLQGQTPELKSQPALEIRQPDWVANAPGADTTSLLLSPDGSTVYAESQLEVLHWGALLGSFLREIVLLFVMLACWPAVLLAWSARRKRRVRGTAYCRKCNYQLTGNASPHCPECGADLKRKKPVIGGSSGRRKFRLASVLVISGLVLGIAGEYRSEIEVWLFENVRWHSVTIMEWATENEIEWIRNCRQPLGAYAAYDARSGDRLFILDMLWGEDIWSPAISQDGRRVYAIKTDYDAVDWLVRWDARTGEEHLRYRLAVDETDSAGPLSVQGDFVYMVRNRALYEFNVITGERRSVTEIPQAYTSSFWIYAGYQVDAESGLVATWFGNRITIHRTDDGTVIRELALPDDNELFWSAVLVPNTVYYVAIDEFAESLSRLNPTSRAVVYALSIETGDRSVVVKPLNPRTKLPEGEESQSAPHIQQIAIDHTHRFLLVATETYLDYQRAHRHIQVWDLRRKQVVARLDVGEVNGFYGRTQFLADGVTVVSLAERDLSNGFVDQVVYFDLTDVLDHDDPRRGH